MEYTVNMGKDKANMFLRALWSQIRLNLGEGGWNYVPFKDGSKNEIHFGWLSAETLEKPLYIFIKYKQKGTISAISIESSELQENESIMKKVEDCIKKAMNFDNHLNMMRVTYYIKALEHPIGSCSGRNFRITPTNNESLNILELDILGFDKVDIRSEARATYNKVLDILSVETQSVFFHATSGEQGEKLKVQEIETDNNLWYGSGRPVVNNYFTLSMKAKLLIDNVVAGEDERFNKYLNACRLFHSAHKYHMLGYKSEELNISKQIRNLQLPNEEVAAVLYMSALEVASDKNVEKKKKCEVCGNPIYSISSRVLEYVQHFEANDYIVKNFYSDRSVYLHAGRFFSDQSYTGTAVPQLDLNSTSGCKSHIPMRDLYAVSDVVAFCLRQHLQEITKETLVE